jgi:hypothetical protein
MANARRNQGGPEDNPQPVRGRRMVQPSQEGDYDHDKLPEDLGSRRAETPAEKATVYVNEMTASFVTLQQVLAAFVSLDLSYRSFVRDLKPGERGKGLPIFRFPATLNGIDQIEAVVDLKHVDPSYVGHVLVPLINAQTTKLMEAVDDILAAGKSAKAALAAMIEASMQEAQPEQEQHA